MAATKTAGVIAGVIVLGAGTAQAADLPEDRADLMYHLYDGGGVKASGPAVLLRKKVAEGVSLNGTYYVDMVSNASIDVVTTASAYKETRNEYAVGADYVYRDTSITLGTSTSREPDYTSNATSLDVSQEVFSGLTTISTGFTRGADKVGKKGLGYFDTATHWKYRAGLTQILSPRWLASANAEIIADSGYLGSPYRVARVFGAAVPERDPRTRSSRSVNFRVIGDVSGLLGSGAGSVAGTGSRAAVRAEYRYFWDTWDIKAHTAELGLSRYFGDKWLVEGFTRYYTQTHALFYSDNAATETQYVSRNRQLGSFNDVSVGAKVSYTVRQVPGSYEVKLNGAYQYIKYKFNDFTDLRTGTLYDYSASVVQLFATATF